MSAEGDGRLPEPLLGAGLREAFRTEDAEFGGGADSCQGPGGRLTGRGIYELIEEVGRGGMGVVLRARDLTLERDVAVKVLAGGSRDPEKERRFMEEARIGARLQHPGIVPVYELGTTQEGHPYFTMRLLEGRSLKDVIGDHGARPSERAHLLAIFGQVCQAVGYAHAQGIVHRDLKPANVMLGSFGEVQVVDWGLAKGLGDPEAPDAERSLASREAAAHEMPEASRTGSVKGTPSFMSPEQARGSVHELDARSDVFALGGILCVILTGAAPYAGNSTEARQRAAEADLAATFARLEGCGADRALIDLAQRCLAERRGDRPADAGAVAAEVAAYRAALEERARRAEIESAETRVRAREERKLLLSLAAAGLVVVAGASGVWAWNAQRKAQRRATVDARVETARAEARVALGQARTSSSPESWREAVGAAEGARLLAGDREVSPTLAERVAALEREIRSGWDEARHAQEQGERNARLLTRIEDARAPHGASPSSHAYARDWCVLAASLASAFAEYGLPIQGGQAGSDAALDEGGEDLPGAWAETLRAGGIDPVLGAAGLDEWAAASRRAGKDGTAKRILEAASLLDPDPLRAHLREAIRGGEPDELKRVLDEADPDGLPVATLRLLGDALAEAGERVAALEVLRRAQRRAPNDFAIAVDLARWLFRGDQDEARDAVSYYRAALALRPASIEVRHELGMLLDGTLGRHAEAEAIYLRALELDPQDAHLYDDLGVARRHRGDLAGAIEAYERSLEIEPEVVPVLSNLGEALLEWGRTDRALEVLAEAVGRDSEHGPSQYNRGLAAYFQGDLRLAAASWNRASEIDPSWVSAAYNHGIACERLGETEEALGAYRQAAAIDENHAGAQKGIGNILWGLSDLEGAEHAFRLAVELDPKDAGAWSNLGHLLLEQDRAAEAAPAFRRAVEAKPELWPALYGLGVALGATGELDEAATVLREALRLKPTKGHVRAKLAIVLERSGQAADAVDVFEQAFAQDEGVARAHREGAARTAARAFAEGRRPEDARRAVRWLRAELEVIAESHEAGRLSSAEASARLEGWLADEDLASIRGDAGDGPALPADLRDEAENLWGEVDRFLGELGE